MSQLAIRSMEIRQYHLPHAYPLPLPHSLLPSSHLSPSSSSSFLILPSPLISPLPLLRLPLFTSFSLAFPPSSPDLYNFPPFPSVKSAAGHPSPDQPQYFNLILLPDRSPPSSSFPLLSPHHLSSLAFT